MTDSEFEALGPVDYLVVEFPLGKANFKGEAISELESLVERGLIRVLDLIFIEKNADGSMVAFEGDEYEGDVEALRNLNALALALLAEEDVDAIAEALEPDTVAAVLVWENTWAAPFGSAVRRAGGQLVADGRIPVQAILAALEAYEEAEVMEGA
jgi:Family of unknown function (DUF6325)